MDGIVNFLRQFLGRWLSVFCFVSGDGAVCKSLVSISLGAPNRTDKRGAYSIFFRKHFHRFISSFQLLVKFHYRLISNSASVMSLALLNAAKFNRMLCVFFGRYPFEIFHTVVGWVRINVINERFVQWIGNEGICDQTMNGKVSALTLDSQSRKSVAIGFHERKVISQSDSARVANFVKASIDGWFSNSFPVHTLSRA